VTGNARLRLETVLAFAAIYLIWGTTYLAIVYCLQGGLPPFAAAALRFIAGTVLIGAWLFWREPRPLAGLPLGRLAWSGVLLLGGGNGLTVWAQQGVPSGIAALLIAASPVMVMAVNWALFDRQPPAALALIGALVGLSGVAVMVAQMHVLAGETRVIYLLALFAAMICWSAGSLLARGQVPAGRVAAAIGVQMAAGAAALVVMAWVEGDWAQLHWGAVTARAWWSLAYLVVFGSLVALSCFLWLLGRVAPQKAMSYALVNPLVALLLGALLLGERLTAMVFIAVALVLAGVAVVLMQGRQRA
jgi:drug/metabolite transporter (DMT)-like permease